jgi:hypothetical protein
LQSNVYSRLRIINPARYGTFRDISVNRINVFDENVIKPYFQNLIMKKYRFLKHAFQMWVPLPTKTRGNFKAVWKIAGPNCNFLG